MTPTHTAPTLPGAGHQRLHHINQARRAVLAEGRSGPVPALAPWIEQSWRRCLAQGRGPDQRVEFEPVSAAQMRQVHDHSRPLVMAARATLDRLARAMADMRYFALLTDAQGVVVTVSGPVDAQDRRASAIARVGVDLSEQAVGTTAIGAALAELQPVWLHRGEHFFAANASYSCAGAPLWGPDGRCVGMLDLTGIDVPERPALKHLVAQSARAIENSLTLTQPHELRLRLNWLGQGLGGDTDGLVCLDRDGMITGRNRAASDMLNLVPGAPPSHCADVFAVSCDELFDAARNQRAGLELPLWSGLRVIAQVMPGGERQTGPGAAPQAAMPLRDLEVSLIRRAVDDARGNVMQAARALGISRATVYRKLGRRG